jgi:hypothetical protein
MRGEDREVDLEGLHRESDEGLRNVEPVGVPGPIHQGDRQLLHLRELLLGGREGGRDTHSESPQRLRAAGDVEAGERAVVDPELGPEDERRRSPTRLERFRATFRLLVLQHDLHRLLSLEVVESAD